MGALIETSVLVLGLILLGVQQPDRLHVPMTRTIAGRETRPKEEPRHESDEQADRRDTNDLIGECHR